MKGVLKGSGVLCVTFTVATTMLAECVDKLLCDLETFENSRSESAAYCFCSTVSRKTSPTLVAWLDTQMLIMDPNPNLLAHAKSRKHARLGLQPLLETFQQIRILILVSVENDSAKRSLCPLMRWSGRTESSEVLWTWLLPVAI